MLVTFVFTLILASCAIGEEVNNITSSYEEEVARNIKPQNRQEYIKLISEVGTNLLGSTTEKVLLPNGVNIEDYVAAFNISNKIVYYHSGYDNEGRPVWIAEVGKWPIRQILEAGYGRDLNWHVKQILHRAFKTVEQRATADERALGLVCILDFEGLRFEELTYIPSAMFLFSFIENIVPVINKFVGDLIILNASYFAEHVMRFLRPVLGGIFDRTVIYGTNKDIWLPKLLRLIPANNIPEWYGGSKDYKPVQVFG